MKGCILWEGPHTAAGGQCKEEGVAESSCSGLTTTPIPHLTAPPEERRWSSQERKSEAEPAKKLGEECISSIVFYFTLSYSVINLQ